MVLDMLDCWDFFFFFCWVFLVSLFLHPDLGFWAVANNGGGVGGGSLVRLFDGSVSWLWCWIC